MARRTTLHLVLMSWLTLSGCSGSGGGDAADLQPQDLPPGNAGPGNQVGAPARPPADNAPLDGQALDTELRTLIEQNGLTGDPAAGRDLPSIGDPLVELGRRLFFSKSLGGDFDAACVSCHHPSLGGADSLSLSVGAGTLDPDLLGPGRMTMAGVPTVARNAPSTFNAGLFDSGLFWDSRVESLGKLEGQNGAVSGISTPESGQFVVDVMASAGSATLPSAQARFPVVSVVEMRGSLEAGASSATLRQHLAARLGDFGTARGELAQNEWLAAFRTAFVSAAPAEALITFDNIAAAIAAYERSQVFVDSPWRSYVEGDTGAIGDAAKRGAVLFLTPADRRGGGCVQCHSGDAFTDEQHHAIGAPQFGPGTGAPDDNDFGRENVTGSTFDRFRFRTPSLLNVAVTAPYMHTGAYATLAEVLRHYDNPNQTVDRFFGRGGWCSLAQFAAVPDCARLYPAAEQNSALALDKIASERSANDPAALPNINLDSAERDDIVAFLETLTDPCVLDRDCLAPWIAMPDEAPDEHQLDAHDRDGNPL
jgi:cytochrome c peroxidase